MSLPKIILVPTDFGEPSDAALDYAVELAKALGAEIVLVHAYEIPLVGMPDGAVIMTGELTAHLAESARVGLERQLSMRSGAGVRMRGVIKESSAHVAIAATAEEVSADLIVIGTHGRRGIPRMLLGSVAEKVVRSAKVPVLTVHPRDVERDAVEAAPRSNGYDRPVSQH